jgi:hypothetical protein
MTNDEHGKQWHLCFKRIDSCLYNNAMDKNGNTQSMQCYTPKQSQNNTMKIMRSQNCRLQPDRIACCLHSPKETLAIPSLSPSISDA